MVGHNFSHCRLDSSQQQHQFCENWQTLTLECYRFSFDTSSLARFRECKSLTVASNCTFSHIALRALYVTILQMNKLFISLKSYTLLLVVNSYF
nr:MAG TPA: hypothetical protein [Caudoviricetes sp.]DAT49010.1 MAG TPA: hypothetical protein [Caudoviricetes sp.]